MSKGQRTLVMMVSGAHLDDAEEEIYTDSELIEEEEEEEEYSDEIGEVVEADEAFVPKTFEEFQTMFKQKFESPEETKSMPQSSSSEPQSVDREMEMRVEQELLKKPEKVEKVVEPESPEPETSPDEGPFSQEDDYEPDDPEDLSGKTNPLRAFRSL